MKTDIEIKAKSFDAFIKSQEKKKLSVGGYPGGIKSPATLLHVTYYAIKTAEMLKDKKVLPRVKCKDGWLIAETTPGEPLNFSHLGFSQDETIKVRLVRGDTSIDYSLSTADFKRLYYSGGGFYQLEELTFNSPYIKTSSS